MYINPTFEKNRSNRGGFSVLCIWGCRKDATKVDDEKGCCPKNGTKMDKYLFLLDNICYVSAKNEGISHFLAEKLADVGKN